ncbi:hypothetical protein OAU50_00625 [Planctomycetota bacterium]|nr:hypothetical protein [Planctomycetota bacterium]
MFGFFSIKRDVRPAFWRDAQLASSRAATNALATAVGFQLLLQFGGSGTMLALTQSGVFAGLLLSLVYVQLGSRVAPFKLLRWSEIAMALCMCAVVGYWFGWFHGPLPLAIILGLGPALGALGVPIISSSYASLYPADSRGRIVSTIRMIHGMTGLAVMTSVGAAVSYFPNTAPVYFVVSGIMVIIGVVRFTKLLDGHGPQIKRARGLDFLRVLRDDVMFRRFQFWQFILGISNLAAIPLLAVYVKEELGLPLPLAVLVVPFGAIENGVVLVSARVMGTVFDRIGVVKHRVVSSLLLAVCFAIWAVTDNFVFAVIAALFGGLGRAGGGVVWQIGSLYFAKKGEEGLYSGIHTALTGIRGVIGPLLAILLFETVLGGNYVLYLGITSGLIVISALGHALTVKLPKEPIH